MKAGIACLALIASVNAQADTVDITTNLTGTNTWHSTNEYVIHESIYVLTNSVLIIEPGTVVRGAAGTGPQTAILFITQGAKIFANGTRARPIIFTSETDDLNDPTDIALYDRNLWGGIVVLGRSVLNTAVDSTGNGAPVKYDVFEGLTDVSVSGQSVHRYGGSDDNDNSGVLRYVSIRHSSVVILPNKEINGLSLGAVGRGTTIENIEIFAAGDDSVEFFGGTVNTKYMASIFSDDDNFDIDQGYRGMNQFWFILQAPDRKDNGGEWNGEPAGIAASNAPLANFEIYNATFIGAGTNVSGNSRVLLSRDYAAPKVHNSIFTEFNTGMNIDASSGKHFTNGTARFQNNILWNIASNGVAVAFGQNAVATWVLTNAANSNLVVDPLITSITRTNVPAFGLDPRPQLGSPALNSPPTLAPTNGFYTPVAYYGAFENEDAWIADWTFTSQAGMVPRRPAIGDVAHTVTITGNLTGTNTWYRTNEYIISGSVYVLTNSVLNIQPGTVVRGAAGTGPGTAILFITQGAKLFARGTEHSPIIFTSETDDLDDPTDIALYDRNLWGGIVVLGRSVLNTAVDSTGNGAPVKYDVFEGLTDVSVSGQSVHRYGGSDDNDSSGVLRYMSIRHSSVVILPNKEINGLSLGAVGRGTTIENIEIFAAGDDSVEFFGGTVNTKYMSSIFSDDDNFDIDQGYRGKNQFWFILQAPDRKDNGGEWNGEPAGIAASNAPLANFEIYNATFIGAGTNVSGNSRVLLSRDYAAPKVHNSIFTEFNTGMNIDATSGKFFTNGTARFQNNILWNIASNGVAVPFGQNAVATWVLTNAANSNLVVDPLITSISRTNVPAFKVDPRPAEGSPALSSALTAPNDGFYTPVAYKGAFTNINWAGDWGFAAEASLMSGAGVGIPVPFLGVIPAPLAVTIVVTPSGVSSVDISFVSQSGYVYQLQSKSPIDGVWANEGSSVAGTGLTMAITRPKGGTEKYYRVLAQ